MRISLAERLRRPDVLSAGAGSDRSSRWRGTADRRKRGNPAKRRDGHGRVLEPPEETAAAFTEDGWLRTGDVGYVDDEGYIFIVDRVKDMVISGGGPVALAPRLSGSWANCPG